MKILINITFSGLTPSAFLAQAQTIVTAMSGNPAFPEPWPATVPAMAQIEADLTAFQNAVIATVAGDRTRIAERSAARETLALDLAQLGFFVQGIAGQDEARLATTGFPLRQRAPRSLVLDAPPAPSDLRLSRGSTSGSLIARARRNRQVGSYDVQITAGDPTVEANWMGAGSYRNCGRIEITNLTSLKIWSVRMRALGSAGTGPWSSPVSLLVL
jgi:hypothetical protein